MQLKKGWGVKWMPSDHQIIFSVSVKCLGGETKTLKLFRWRAECSVSTTTLAFHGGFSLENTFTRLCVHTC
jgi:hypothetical protein